MVLHLKWKFQKFLYCLQEDSWSGEAEREAKHDAETPLNTALSPGTHHHHQIASIKRPHAYGAEQTTLNKHSWVAGPLEGHNSKH